MIQCGRASRYCWRTYRGHRSLSSKPRNSGKHLNKASKLVQRLQPLLISSSPPQNVNARDIYNTSAYRILNAIKSPNHVELEDAWRSLKQTELISSPRHPRLSQFSDAIALHFSTMDLDPGQYTPQFTSLLHEISLYAALFRSTNGLTACLRRLVIRRDPAAILNLYNRFRQGLGENEKWDIDEEPSSGSSFDSSVAFGAAPSHSVSLLETVSRIHILLAAIAAHAMQGTFHEAISMCLNTTTWFTPSFSIRFLRIFTPDAELRERVSTYITRLNLIHLVSHPDQLSRLAHKFASTSSEKALEKLYSDILEAIRGDDAYLRVNESSGDESSFVLSEDVWVVLIGAFIRARRKDLAGRLWADLDELGVQRTVNIWNITLEGYNQAKHPRDAIAVWNMMHADRVIPNARSFKAAISAHFACTRRYEAFELYQTYMQEYSAIAEPEETLSVCNAVLHGLLSCHQYDVAEDLVASMRADGPSPDVVTYNTLLGHYGRQQNFQTISHNMSLMASEGVAWDVFTFSSMLSALMKAGRDDAPILIVKMMSQQQVQPTAATITAIIDHQLGKQKEAHLKAAITLLTLMENETKYVPNDVTYTAFLAGIFRGNWLTVEATEDLKNDILERMKRQRVALTTPTYHVLFQGYLDPRFANGVDEVWKYFCEMKQDRVPITGQTWGILLYGLAKREAWWEAGKVADELKERKYYLSPSLSAIVERIRRKRIRIEY